MELIARQKLPALILVHRQQLLDQWIERIETYLNIPKLRIGRFSSTKKKIGKEITVGLLQSFGRYKNIQELSDKFGTIIIDECHHIPAKTFREVITHLNPRYLYGLTATPKRKHNDEKLIYVYIGDILATLKESGVTDDTEGEQKPKSISVVVEETSLEIPFKWKTDHFNLLAKIICFDTERNKLIVNDILSEIQKENKVLVLSERKEHLEILELYLKGQCEIITISGDDSIPQRTSKIKQIQDGHYQVILSTGQFFGEGLHVQNINSLVLAFPFSFEGKLVQYIGRLLHSTDPKLVFDYRDIKIDFLDRQFKQRQRYCDKLKKAR
ncbi:MAG: DEAD/DEAH box helicase family protein [Candidatus Zambryskibacteria bacterium]|nr:DEAD/DEAH box helicase family protein [Candidatus Zambryskibacteria bacterium]